MTAARFLLVGVLSTAFVTSVGCCNTSSNADPTCPDGRQASATLTVVGELDGIRPAERAKDIQVRGNRETADPCIEDGALSAFSVRLQGDARVVETLEGLAPGAWAINVTALSGGDQPPINEVIVLLAGRQSQLQIGAAQTGQMVLQ